jgi:hypothetical protein
MQGGPPQAARPASLVMEDRVTNTHPDVGYTADNQCLGCGAALAAGCQPTCPAGPDRTLYLAESLPSGGQRRWRMSGIKYTGTPARRAAVVALINEVTWVRPIDQPMLPASTAHMIDHLAMDMGVAHRLGSVAFDPLARLRVPDCTCRPQVCRCDEPRHPYQGRTTCLWAEYSLFAMRVRLASHWQTSWLLHLGIAAVWLLDDWVPAPNPQHLTRACFLDWCDRCAGTGRGPDERGERRRCGCTNCHAHPGSGAAQVSR